MTCFNINIDEQQQETLLNQQPTGATKNKCIFCRNFELEHPMITRLVTIKIGGDN